MKYLFRYVSHVWYASTAQPHTHRRIVVCERLLFVIRDAREPPVCRRRFFFFQQNYCRKWCGCVVERQQFHIGFCVGGSVQVFLQLSEGNEIELGRDDVVAKTSCGYTISATGLDDLLATTNARL